MIGNVRVGEKRLSERTGKEYPVSLDYFKGTGDYAVKFDEAYPGKPTKIQIVFISDDDFQSCFEEWDGRNKEGRRSGYGDGETFHLWNGRAYEPTTDRAKMDVYTQENGVTWKPVLTLHFIIPAIRGIFGCWKFQTSGDKSSMISIRSMFDEIKSQAGTVVNIPFDLTVKKVKGNKPGDKTNFPVVTLVPNISTENMEQLRGFMETGLDMKKIGMLTEAKIAALPYPGKNDDVELLTPTEAKAYQAAEPKITGKQVSDLKEVGFTEAEIKKASEYPPIGTMFPVDPKDPEKPENSFDN